MSEEGKAPKQMPKGVRKGGTRFPRYSLEDAVVWARRLVSKTHTGPQTQDIIFAAVVDAKSATAEIRVSALKQYGLMSGTSKAYTATDVAKSISVAPEDEIVTYLAQAALNPAIFKSLFETFHGDGVARAKLKQRAADLEVHPDQLDACVDLYIDTLKFAGLVQVQGDKVVHVPLDRRPSEERVDQPPNEIIDREVEEGVDVETGSGEDKSELDHSRRPQAVFHVNVNLDASMDVEKLQKQLDLLKRYGAI